MPHILVFNLIILKSRDSLPIYWQNISDVVYISQFICLSIACVKKLLFTRNLVVDTKIAETEICCSSVKAITPEILVDIVGWNEVSTSQMKRCRRIFSCNVQSNQKAGFSPSPLSTPEL